MEIILTNTSTKPIYEPQIKEMIMTGELKPGAPMPSMRKLARELHVINCRKEFFDTLHPEDILSYRREPYGYKVMVRNKQGLRKIFPDLEIENASIEDLMLFQVKGEHVPCQDLF